MGAPRPPLLVAATATTRLAAVGQQLLSQRRRRPQIGQAPRERDRGDDVRERQQLLDEAKAGDDVGAEQDFEQVRLERSSIDRYVFSAFAQVCSGVSAWRPPEIFRVAFLPPARVLFRASSTCVL